MLSVQDKILQERINVWSSHLTHFRAAFRDGGVKFHWSQTSASYLYYDFENIQDYKSCLKKILDALEHLSSVERELARLSDIDCAYDKSRLFAQ